MRKGFMHPVGITLIGLLVVLFVAGCGSADTEIRAEEEARIERRVKEEVAEEQRQEHAKEEVARDKRQESRRQKLFVERAQLGQELDNEVTAWQTVSFTGPCQDERQQVLEEISGEVADMKRQLELGNQSTISAARTDLDVLQAKREAGPVSIYQEEAICSPLAALHHAW